MLTIVTTGSGCQLDTDTVWELEWPFTAAGSVAVQACPGLSKSTGKLHGVNITMIFSNNT